MTRRGTEGNYHVPDISFFFIIWFPCRLLHVLRKMRKHRAVVLRVITGDVSDLEHGE